MFFSTFQDMEPILKEIEDAIQIRYYRTGLHSESQVQSHQSFFDIPEIKFAISGDWNRLPHYLVIKKGVPLEIRKILQRTGELRFAVDQMVNRNSIDFKLGGIFQGGTNVIVAGRVSTISNLEDSAELFKMFFSKIKREFKKIDGFYVGGDAEKKMRNGWRLVTNVNLSKEFDLLPQS